MFPTNFDYTRATSVQEAVALLSQNPEAKLLAGGHSLLPAMKLRLAQPSLLIDISHIAELKGVSKAANGWSIGAVTTHAEVARADVPNALKTAASRIGDVQVRNLGTIGGSLSHADPAADLPAVMIALGASFRLVGPKGERTVSADDFFTGLFTTAVQAGEVLTTIMIPATAAKSAYAKHSHPASGYAVVGVAAAIEMDGKGACTKASLAVTGACASARRLKATEAALMGKALNANALKAASAAGDGLDCLSDHYASASYRAHLTGVLARRAVEACMM